MEEICRYSLSFSGIELTVFGRGNTVFEVVFGDVPCIKTVPGRHFEIVQTDIEDEIPCAFKRYFRDGVIENLRPEFLWGTSFQRAVWEEISKIPVGKTTTYGQIAEKLGRPRAARAVGQAVGANPIPIIVPCHRVFAKKSLGGFSAGIEIKSKLLKIEGFSLTQKK